jgi:hypothetical protein
MADVNFGIKQVKFAPAESDGTFPDFDDDGIIVPMIVVDSFVYDKEDDQTSDITWEDFDDVGIKLPGQKGNRSIVLQTNDLEDDVLEYFTGMTVSNDWKLEGVGFELSTQAMQIITRTIDTYPAKQIEYAKLKVEVKESGTLGKNGLPNLTLTCTVLANMNTSGVQIPGKRWKALS